MSVYSAMHHAESLMKSESADIKIPGGLKTSKQDWYPFVMTFSADIPYSCYIGEPDARLDIMYNFPAFAYTKGCSRLFDRQSDFYNSFYGAYIVRDSSNERLKQGIIDEERAADIARFDFFNLVLEDFGLSQTEQVFDFTVTDRQNDIDYAGYQGWSHIKAEIKVNGAAHENPTAAMSYLQYGKPNFGEVKDDFAPVDMSGLIYARYFPGMDAGVYFYVMAASEEVCDECDREILSQSKLSLDDRK